jgi:outer membrane murein-binding lipoprotein Lpp
MKYQTIFAVVVAASVLAGCGKSDEEKRMEAARAASLEQTAKRDRTAETLKPLVLNSDTHQLEPQK